MISIELTDQEAELFKLFRQYQGIFESFIRAGFLDFKCGSITFHYNPEGQIVKYEKRQMEEMPSYGKI